jgi:hypothetical protein
MILHPLCDNDILCTMVTTNTTRNPVLLDCLHEQIMHSLRPIVVDRVYPSNKAGLPVNKAMDDDFETNQA